MLGAYGKADVVKKMFRDINAKIGTAVGEPVGPAAGTPGIFQVASAPHPDSLPGLSFTLILSPISMLRSVFGQ